MINTQSIQSKPDMIFPRYIFAIGGAGKDLIYTMLEKEWILREILRPKFSPTTVMITIIDTSIAEENKDRERIELINSNIKKLEEEYRSDPSNVDRNIGRIYIDYKLLTKKMVLTSPYDLIGIGDSVKQATGASIWWINDIKLGEDWHKKVVNEKNLKEMNFNKGVYRKRAIGKAIYYKAVSEGLFDIDLLQSAQIDIVVGLGGGTGSGMALDLAKRLKNIQPTADIALFGILSTLNESPDEKANNFAMISELEYGCLNQGNPFKNILLVPMEITRYPGRERAMDEHERLLREFDETFPYILISYHNTDQGQMLFSNLPDFAPFIIATPQIVRYNVDSIKNFKTKLVEALNDKELSLNDEEKTYNNIEKFIRDFIATDHAGEGALPDEDRSFLKEERFSKFEMILNHEFFKELGYNSVMHLKKAVEAGIRGSISNDIEKQISSIKAETDAIPIGEGYRDDVDSMLYKILKKDIENIEILKNVLIIINRIEDNLIRDTLKTIIKVDIGSLGRKLNQIRDENENLNSKKKQLNSNIEFLKNAMDKYEEELKKEVGTKNQEWKKKHRENIDYLNNIEHLQSILKNDFLNLETELNDYVVKINSLNSIRNVEAESIRPIEDIIDKICKEFETLKLNYEDRNLIIKNAINLKELRKAKIEYGRTIPLIDKLIGILVKTDRLKKRNDAKNKISLKKLELNNDKVFEIDDKSFSCVYKYEIEAKTNEKKDEIINTIVEKTKEIFSNSIPYLFSNLKEILTNSEKRSDANIEEIIQNHLGYEEEKNNKENEIREKQAELSQIVGKERTFKNLEALIENISSILKSHAVHLKNYQNYIMNIDKTAQALNRANKEDIKYITEMQPADIFKATALGANINNIIEDRREELQLKQNLLDGIERTIDNRYSIILRRVIETNDHTKRWDKTKVMNALVTIANINPEFANARSTIINAFSLKIEQNYSEYKCPWGDGWGIGIVLFTAGIPFDNIQNVVDSRAGFYRNYKDIELSDNITFFHHSYMLEEGKYIRRKRVFNLENEEDKQLFLQNDKDIKLMFLNNYEIIELQNAVK